VAQRCYLLQSNRRHRLPSADITIFDPDRIIDRATYRDPTAPSAGIQFVLVNGAVVVENGRIREGVAPVAPSERR
jgi:N-acyl-D-aspartate/D-glutamate deacylase